MKIPEKYLIKVEGRQGKGMGAAAFFITESLSQTHEIIECFGEDKDLNWKLKL